MRRARLARGSSTFARGLTAQPREARFAGTCRVCAGPIDPGNPIVARAWHHEVAHAACGWLRASERAPHEASRPGTFDAYWEWACTTCGRDVVARAPREDLRCSACKGADPC